MAEKTGKRSKGNITKESKRVEEGERAGEESLELELHLELLPKAKKSPSNTKVEEMKVQLRLNHNFLFFPPLSTSLSFKQVVLLTFPPSPHHFHLSTSPPSLYTLLVFCSRLHLPFLTFEMKIIIFITLQPLSISACACLYDTTHCGYRGRRMQK